VPLETAYQHLADHDPVLSTLITQHGRPDPFAWSEAGDANASDPLSALLLHICGQQISIRAALTVHRRLLDLVGPDPTPEAVIAVPPDLMAAAGLSRAKVASVRDLAQRLSDGRLSLTALQTVGDDEAMAALTAVRGVGPWTAQMYLLHQLRRPDVLPAGDIGLRRAYTLAYQRPDLPSAPDLIELAGPWRPYRSYAVALLWTHLHEWKAAGRAGVATSPDPGSADPATSGSGRTTGTGSAVAVTQ
jgi:DNA-3-methyladenine glycosylase II